MFCSSCGKRLADDAAFCPGCGRPVAGNPQPTPFAAAPPRPVPGVSRPIRSRKERSVALVLCFFLGCFGAHRFYLGKMPSAAVMLIIGFFGLFLFLPLLITGIWSIIDFIWLLARGQESFDAEYNY